MKKNKRRLRVDMRGLGLRFEGGAEVGCELGDISCYFIIGHTGEGTVELIHFTLLHDIRIQYAILLQVVRNGILRQKRRL